MEHDVRAKLTDVKAFLLGLDPVDLIKFIVELLVAAIRLMPELWPALKAFWDAVRGIVPDYTKEEMDAELDKIAADWQPRE